MNFGSIFINTIVTDGLVKEEQKICFNAWQSNTRWSVKEVHYLNSVTDFKKNLCITFSRFSDLNVAAFQYQKSLLSSMIHTKNILKKETLHWILSCMSEIRIFPIHIAWQWILISFFARTRNLLKSLGLRQFILAVIQGFNVQTSDCKNA